MALTEPAPGPRRWTSCHDQREEEFGSPAPETVDGLVLVDPLDPPPEVEPPVERVLVSHREPVLRDGADVLGGLLQAPSAA
ncbi:MAG TPA: hypothetical protein VJ689_04035 [Gaiellaceae bacterium]|nr:hypothetical protein [Gaiellaceae bacterium]